MNASELIEQHPVYLGGPALFAPVMAVVSAAYSPWQHYNSWMVWPILLGVPVLLGWHLVLVVKKPGSLTRLEYVAYAIFNLIFYVFVAAIFCLGAVTGDWL